MTTQFTGSASGVCFTALSVSSQSSGERCLRKTLRRALGRARGFAGVGVALMLLGSFCLATPALPPTLATGWYQQSPAANPGGRFDHAITYDAAHGQVVLFGGDGDPNDTWLWDGTTWTQAVPPNTANNPGGRANAAMVYDAAHGQVVMFGGLVNGVRLGDTWLWNGTSWTQANPASSPSPRDGTALVYDAAHSQVVLYGGITQNGFANSETWVWNGTNWTNVSPPAANSPGGTNGLFGHAMVYDAAHSQVVLFGGASNGSDQNWTWIWNGSAWAQQSPANSPTPRDSHGMTYNAALGQTVIFGGYNGNSNLGDTWVFDGTNWTNVTPANPANSPSARAVPSEMTYDAALGQVILYDGTGQLADAWEFGLPGNFGNVTMCPALNPNTSPCSNSVAFTYKVQNTTTFGTNQAVTQGTTGLDFSLAGASTCTGTVAAGNSCSVTVKFAPAAPGLRMGAVNLFDNSGDLLLTTPVFGVGQGPAIAFSPGPQTTVNTGNFTLSRPAGVAVDAAGNVFISDNGNGQVLKIGNGTQTVVYGPTPPGAALPYYPQGLAVDGAGNLYVADNNRNLVVEVPLGCTSPSCQISLGSNIAAQLGVAVDGAGDVFMGDFTGHQVVEIPAGCTSNSCQTVVYNPGASSNPVGLAVDAAGDLFIADYGLNTVLEIPAGCPTCRISVGTNWTSPEAVAVDAAGDVFVAEEFAPYVVEVPVGCGNGSCQVTVNVPEAYGLALDGLGDLFVPELNGNQVIKVNYSQPPSLTFATTNVGSTSSDSPQTITIQNIGNQTLNAISPGLAISGSNFIFAPGQAGNGTCTVNSALTPGETCNVGVSFAPHSAGNPLTSAAIFTDNALNRNPATQTFSVSGVGTSSSFTIGGTVTGLVGSGLVLQDNLANNQAVSANGPFTFSAPLSAGSPYSVTALSSPAGQSCGVTNGSGVVSSANITNVLVSCVNLVYYPLTVTEIGSGTGTVTDLGQITCGSVPGTCSGSYQAGTQVTLTASATGTSIFTGWGGSCASAGTSPTCTVTMNAAASVSASFVQQNFGNVNVCSAGQTTPAPCSTTLPATYNAPSDTTIGVIQVVTQGLTGLDFTPGTGSTCAGAISGGSSCTVNVKFAPLAPGLRLGAVQIFDDGGNLLTSIPIYGVGQGPVVVFSPGVQTTVPTNGLSGNTQGLAVDAAGNIYIADGNANTVVKVTPAGTQTTVPVTGPVNPSGVAVDGAGDVFIVFGSAAAKHKQVVEVTPLGVQTTVNTGSYLLTGSSGLAVDGAGNLFIADTGDSRVVEVPANGGAPSTVGTGLNSPVGVAVDGAGDVFIADKGLGQVLEVPANGGPQSTVGTGFTTPVGVAVDAAGDVIVADNGRALNGLGNRVVEVPAGCSSSNCQLTLLNGGQTGFQPSAVAVDGAGDVFIGIANGTSTGQVVELNSSQPPILNFPLTNTGSVSNQQSVGIQNVGNQPLTGAFVFNLSTSFFQGSSCASSFPLAPGALCYEGFGFAPQSTGYLTGTAVLSDNTLNSSPLAVHTINLVGTSGVNGQAATVAVPDVSGQTQAAAATTLTGTGLALGSVFNAASGSVPSGGVISTNPAAGTQVNVGSAVELLISTGQPQPLQPNPLSLLNNYFVTGDYAAAGVTLRGKGVGGTATGTITIPSSGSQSVPNGADIIDAYLYWQTLENTSAPSASSGTFRGYSITGQQIGKDIAYTDGTFSGTLRVYRADVNAYLPAATDGSGIRYGSGTHTVALPDGGSAMPLTEGASLVVIYRVLSPNFPLKSVVIYDGSAIPTSSGNQAVQGFYDALGGTSGTGEYTNLNYASGGGWNNSFSTVTIPAHGSSFSAPLNANTAYAAVIVSVPVTNSDNDGILDGWKAGPGAGDFHTGQPGYYDVATGSWVPLPGAQHGHKDLFVQLDYMCGAVLSNGACDPAQENLFPSPDAQGNDPVAMVTQAFASNGVTLHLQVGNAVPEDTCTDNLTTNPPQLCQFPNQPGVIGWKNSLEFSKLWPRNLASCLAGGDCTTRYPFGQKDSYHYVLFGHSLAIPAWNSRYGTLTSISVSNGVTTIGTTNRGSSTSLNYCPSRITISGVLGNPSLNGVYNTTGCTDAMTMTVATPGVPNWSYPNSTLPEPVIGLTSGTITSISGYSDLGGADSAITLGLWLTAPNQDMSKRANVTAGTLFHEIGHTLGLSHGGIYYDGPAGNYVPTFEANCKPNYQSIMNYLFQLDLVGQGKALNFSNQQLRTLNESSAGSVTQLTDLSNNAATYPTTAWYVPYTTGVSASPATLHCDGSPINGGQAYRVVAPIVPITPPWANGQDINYDGQLNTQMRGYNDWSNVDLRQIGATGGEFASLATILSFTSSTSPVNVGAGGTVALGSGGTVALGSGGTVTLGSGGNVTLGSGGTITMGSGGNVTLGSGGNVTLGSGGTITMGSGGNVTLGSGGNVTLGSGGTITLGSGGTIALGSGGNVTLGSGGTIALGSGGTVTIPSTGGSYSIDSNGGTITLGSGGNVTLGSGGNVTLGSGGTIALGSGGNVTLGSGGNVTLGSGGTIALGSGGTIALGSGGNVTLGSGGTIALGSGGTVTLGSGGNVTLGSGGTVTLGSGGNVTLGSGGNVTLGSGGTATLGAGGTVTLGSGGNVTLGSGGNVTLGSGGTIAMGSGGTVTLGSGGTVTLGSGGTIALGSGGSVTIPPGGSYTINGSGGTITLGSGGNVTLGSGGNVTLGSGGTITMGSGGNITLGSGGTVTLGSGGNVTLGSGGNVTLGSGGTIALGSGGTIALGSGGNITLGSGGALSTELTYDTANSIVRPPPAATETPMQSGPVRVNWTAPAFGVVSTYTIYRSSNGAAPIEIGSVSGVNGFPPATTFLDTNPDLTSTTVVYTISTTVVPDVSNPAPRQSPPSPPAVLKNDQTISLGTLPSSVTLSNTPLTVTATAMSNGVANGLQVSFSATSATSSCSIGSQSIANGVSSATVTLNSAGSCTITALQTGSDSYNAASPASGTFTILPQGSNLQSQTITFAPLQNVQYGGTFSLSASSSSHLTVSFTSSGPCNTAGNTTGVGVCKITASAPANSTYSAASVSQSFNVFPAVLKVTANNLTSGYGQALPTLTYGYTGFVNNDPSSVVSGTPALSTTATSTSSPGNYPITVATGTLTAANYSFLYVNGTLAIQSASQAALTLNAGTPLTYNTSESLSATGGSGTGAVTYAVTGGTGTCSVSGSSLTATSGTGTCLVTATKAADSNYKSITSNTVTVTLQSASQSALTLSAGTMLTYNASETLSATGGSGTGAVSYAVTGGTGTCSITGTSLTATSGTGTCMVTATKVADSNYQSLTSNIVTVNLQKASETALTLSAGAMLTYNASEPLSATGGSGTGAVSYALTGGTGTCSITGTSLTATSGTGTCLVTATKAGDSNYQSLTSNTVTVNLQKASETATLVLTAGMTLSYNTSETLSVTGGSGTGAVSYAVTGGTGTCSITGASLTATSGTGSCLVTATKAADNNYQSIASNIVTVTLQKASQTALTLNAATPLTYNTSEPLSTTGGSGTGAVSYAVTGGSGCSITGTSLTATSGTGSCLVTATKAADNNYNLVTSTAKTVTLALATESITLTSIPTSAVYNSSFTVGYTAGASGDAVTFTSSGGCSNVGATYTMISGTTACSVIATELGNNNFSNAPTVTKTVAATLATPVITWPTPVQIVYGTPLSSTQLDASASFASQPLVGTFTYNPAAGTVLSAGSHTLSVSFVPAVSANFSTATATVSLNVFAATVTMGITTQTQTYQHWTNFVIGPIFTGSRVPTGTVTLYDNGAAVMTLPLGGNGLAYYTAGPFNVGANVMTASYSGDSHFAAGSASPVTITVNPAPVNFMASCWGGTPWTAPYQCTVNVSAGTTIQPTGSITYSMDGAAPTSVALSGGNAAFTVPTVPAAGNHTLTINYAAQGNYAAGTQITKTFTTAQGQTLLLITPSNYSPVAGSSVTLSGKASTPSSGIPTGSVTFYDGATAIGTSPISTTNGAVSYTVASITKGSHSYSAKYAGSTNYTAATSGTAVVTAH